MKYLLFLFLACIASLEFVHQLSNSDTRNAMICTVPHTNLNGVGEIYRQHLDSRR